MKEQDKQSKREKWGARLTWGGIIAGILGFLAENLPVVVVSTGIALSGVIFENSGNKKQTQY